VIALLVMRLDVIVGRGLMRARLANDAGHHHGLHDVGALVFVFLLFVFEILKMLIKGVMHYKTELTQSNALIINFSTLFLFFNLC
jgi:hypothetical protein